MTIQAVIAENLAVAPHKIHLDLHVTGIADGLIKFCVILSMTILANESRTVGFGLVGVQRISQHSVREGHHFPIGQRGLRTVMFSVAVPAGQDGSFLGQRTVQGRGHQQLNTHICMTDHTPVGHAVAAPKGGMAQTALVAEFRMRAHAAQEGTAPGIQSAGVEQLSALYQQETCDDQGGQNPRQDRGSADKTRPGSSHHSTTVEKPYNTTPRQYERKQS